MAQRRDTEQRKREIAAAALRLAGTKGFHKLTTSMLAKEVGLSDGAIFRHFANKKEIIDATILRFEELLMQDFPPTDAHPLQRLRALFFQRVQGLLHIVRIHNLVADVIATKQPFYCNLPPNHVFGRVCCQL